MKFVCACAFSDGMHLSDVSSEETDKKIKLDRISLCVIVVTFRANARVYP